MKNNLFTDILSSINRFKELRKARKRDYGCAITETVKIPLIDCNPSFFDTVEGCCIMNTNRSVYQAVKLIFDRFQPEEKYKLLLAPEEGEFIARAQFWKRELKPIMQPKQYRKAICSILHWYIHIKRMRSDNLV